ncbi:hypothetical protein ACWPM1_02995 [Tsuneonella sp. HG249]
MRAISLAAILTLAACQQSVVGPEPTATPTPVAAASTGPAPSPSPSPTTGSISSLAGAWRVAGIDGKDFNEPYGLALGGSDRELWWEPRCAGVARSYTIDGGRIAFGPYIGAPRLGEMPPPVCAIGLHPRLTEVTRALDAATTVERTPANGVLISGGGRSLLLFAQ